MGEDHLKGILGNYGKHERTDNGTNMLLLAKTSQLRIINTWFRKRDWYTCTGNKNRFLIDYILYDNRYAQREVLDYKLVSVPESDHRLLYCKMRLTLNKSGLPRALPTARETRINRLNLRCKETGLAISTDLNATIPTLKRELEKATLQEQVQALHDKTYEIALRHCGIENTRKCEDLYSQIKPELLQAEQEVEKAWKRLKRSRSDPRSNPGTRARDKRKHREKKKALQKTRKQKLEKFYKAHNAEIENNFKNDSKHQYGKILQRGQREVRKPIAAKMHHPDGTLAKSSKENMNIWINHSKTLLNTRRDTIDPNIFNEVSDRTISEEAEQELTQPFDMEELYLALMNMDSFKAVGNDKFPIDIWKAVAKADPESLALEYLLEILNECFRTASPIQEWKDITLIYAHKGKGLSPSDPGNYRGIALISHIGKLYAKLLDIRLYHFCEQTNIFPENQYGFRRSRGVQDALFTARFIQQAAKVQKMDLYWVFVDLAKAYDTIPRELLWAALQKIGLPAIVTENIKALHTGMMAKVNVDGNLTEPFDITVGLRQGDVLAPTLFNIYFSLVFEVMDSRISREPEPSIRGLEFYEAKTREIWETKPYKVFEEWPCSKGGCTFVSREPQLTREHESIYHGLNASLGIRDGREKEFTEKLQRSTREYKDRNKNMFHLWRLLFADDAAFFATSQKELQHIVNMFHEVTSKFGLQISKKKTEVMVQNHSRTKIPEANKVIKVDDYKLQVVPSFKYLGGQLDETAKPEKVELLHRRNQANKKFYAHRDTIFKNNGYSLYVRIELYNLLIRTTVLYDCNNWFMTDTALKRIASFDKLKMLDMLKISQWQDISYEDLLDVTHNTDIVIQTKYRRLKWTGKIIRMEPTRITRRILFSNLNGGTNNQLREAIPIQKQIKKDLIDFGIDLDEWQKLTEHQEGWELDLQTTRDTLHETKQTDTLGIKGSKDDKRKLTSNGKHKFKKCKNLSPKPKPKRSKIIPNWEGPRDLPRSKNNSEVVPKYRCIQCYPDADADSNKNFILEASIKNHVARLHKKTKNTTINSVVIVQVEM